MINNLTRTASLSSADLVPLFSASLGGDTAATLSTLATWLQGQLTTGGAMITQYAAPNATGFTAAVQPGADGGSVWLLLTPAAGYAAGTVLLPLQALCKDGQEVVVTSTQAVTALAVSGNGSTVYGAPSTLTANAFLKLRFDGVVKAWYRIG